MAAAGDQSHDCTVRPLTSDASGAVGCGRSKARRLDFPAFISVAERAVRAGRSGAVAFRSRTRKLQIRTSQFPSLQKGQRKSFNAVRPHRKLSRIRVQELFEELPSWRGQGIVSRRAAASETAVGKAAGCKTVSPELYISAEASWRNGYAADCKSVYTGSIPVLASIQELTDLAFRSDLRRVCHRTGVRGAASDTAIRLHPACEILRRSARKPLGAGKRRRIRPGSCVPGGEMQRFNYRIQSTERFCSDTALF